MKTKRQFDISVCVDISAVIGSSVTNLQIYLVIFAAV